MHILSLTTGYAGANKIIMATVVDIGARDIRALGSTAPLTFMPYVLFCENGLHIAPLGYGRVYLSLCKGADKPFHTKRDELCSWLKTGHFQTP